MQAFVDVTKSEVIDSTCTCKAAAGGCKHMVALLFWLEKKASQPASTDVECYWKTPAYRYTEVAGGISFLLQTVIMRENKICLVFTFRQIATRNKAAKARVGQI